MFSFGEHRWYQIILKSILTQLGHENKFNLLAQLAISKNIEINLLQFVTININLKWP